MKRNDVARAEAQRLEQDARRERNWKRWGPYLADRQWGTVREDYSADGDAWGYFTHEHARSRAYRWGEDGLLGLCDRQGRLCFALALWNGRDPILKERLFGLSGPEGNHGEDVKEEYFYLDGTPTGSYLKALYRYPLAEFPYERLNEESARRGYGDPEYELRDTGVLDDGRHVDVVAEYAKAAPDDLLVRITLSNRAPEDATLHVLPTLWFRNTWAWGRSGEGYWPRPEIRLEADGALTAEHASLGRFRLVAGPGPRGRAPEWLFTDNETNVERLFGGTNATPHVKDAFHDHVVHGKRGVLRPDGRGTKAAAHHVVEIPAGGAVELRLRLFAEDAAPADPLGQDFAGTVARRIEETDAFYAARQPAGMTDEERRVTRQGYATLLWNKQFYHYIVEHWLDGDPAHPPPPAERLRGRNRAWRHVYSRDVLSMPDKWEYPWFAAWDLGFHMLPFSHIDPLFAKRQLVLFLREWYMHPNGQIPAYEYALGDVNPPVHAWACWRLYKTTAARGQRDRVFLESAFQKLLLNFTWWVNRKDADGQNLFAGGFLGLDNIGVFDRSRPLPTGGRLQQADGTAWMAFYCITMLQMALKLARDNPAYEDMASKFFEHFVAIADATNALGGSGLWDDQDGFYYDQLDLDGRRFPLRVRSLVGLVPLLAAGIVENTAIEPLTGFRKRLDWFLRNREDLASHIAYMERGEGNEHGHFLLAIPSRQRLERVLGYLLDEREFLSPFGIRSLSRVHAEQPFTVQVDGERHQVAYVPGESDSGMFGGNSNWRGPVWLPMNFLLIEALELYHHFYCDRLTVECPTGSGRRMTLAEVALELTRRVARIFLPDERGARPCSGAGPSRELVPFHEYFHGDTGRGLGASHQSWTALVVLLLEDLARARHVTEND